MYADYGLQLAPLREEVEHLVKTAREWDGRFFNLQVTNATERAMQLRALCTAASSSLAFDLRCKVAKASSISCSASPPITAAPSNPQ
ncbi:hypothetical protein [Variovorax sp. RO1]|uniref:hypothetical protein n=1 Tax=Variovorax sp. RO1 TaxID=2066034 RepID=UPI0015E02C17